MSMKLLKFMAQGLLSIHNVAMPFSFLMPARQKVCEIVNLFERLSNVAGAKMGLALRVALKNPALFVAHRLLGITKLRSERRDF